jgi:hypothetical protein
VEVAVLAVALEILEDPVEVQQEEVQLMEVEQEEPKAQVEQGVGEMEV